MRRPGDIPQEILSSLTIHFVETMDEVQQIALERAHCTRLEHAAVAPSRNHFVAGPRKTRV